MLATNIDEGIQPVIYQRIRNVVQGGIPLSDSEVFESTDQC